MALSLERAEELLEMAQQREDAHRARVAELEALAERRRQERLDALSVTTREGLSASEWVLRTGKAERERNEAQQRSASLHAEVERLTTELARAENLVKTFNESLKDERAMTNEANARVKTAEQALAESERKRAELIARLSLIRASWDRWMEAATEAEEDAAENALIVAVCAK